MDSGRQRDDILEMPSLQIAATTKAMSAILSLSLDVPDFLEKCAGLWFPTHKQIATYAVKINGETLYVV
jgi:hypothetical protein